MEGAADANVVQHTHPGVKVGYVIDGKLDVNGDRPTKILSTYVVDKSKPLVSNVPD